MSDHKWTALSTGLNAPAYSTDVLCVMASSHYRTDTFQISNRLNIWRGICWGATANDTG